MTEAVRSVQPMAHDGQTLLLYMTEEKAVMIMILCMFFRKRWLMDRTEKPWEKNKFTKSIMK